MTARELVQRKSEPDGEGRRGPVGKVASGVDAGARRYLDYPAISVGYGCVQYATDAGLSRECWRSGGVAFAVPERVEEP